MLEALDEAQKAAQTGEIPVGAILVLPDKTLLRAHNTRELSHNPMDHAEIRVLHEAAKILGNWRLNDCDLYVTLEPCPMCLGTLLQTRLRALYFGAADPKRGTTWISGNATLVWPTLQHIDSIQGNNHEIRVHGGCLEAECQKLLTSFFRSDC